MDGHFLATCLCRDVTHRLALRQQNRHRSLRRRQTQGLCYPARVDLVLSIDHADAAESHVAASQVMSVTASWSHFLYDTMTANPGP